MKYTIAILLVTHFVADFLMQSREMGKKKSSEPIWLLQHLIIQYCVFTIVLLPFFDLHHVTLFVIFNTIIHGVIDWNIWRFYKAYAYRAIAKNPKHPLLTENPAEPWKYWEDHWFYATIGFDQGLHSITLIFLGYWLL